MKYLFSIMAVLVCCNSYARLSPVSQRLDDRKCLDTANLEIRYSFKFKHHSSQSSYNEDFRVVQIGRTVVKDYSDIVFHYDSLATVATGTVKKHNPHVTFPCEIYSYPGEKRRREKYRMISGAGALSYPSEWEDPVWEYSSDDPVLLDGYSCNSAKTKYAGREYTAWYTLDVPVPYGPYKFYGLPGLIVKIEESSGMYVWEICSLSKKSVPIYIYRYEREQECTAESAARTIRSMMTTPIAFLMSVGTKMIIKRSDGSWGPPVKETKEFPYEPIELR